MKKYFKTLNVKYLLIIAAISLTLAITNNILKDDARSVEWFSGQEILETPEGF